MSLQSPLIQVYYQKKLGCLNFGGDIIIPIAYQEMMPQSEGWRGIKQAGKWGFWNIEADQVGIPLIYEEVKFFREGLVPVKQGGKWGVINTKNQWVIPAQYAYVHAFSEGLAATKEGDKWGFINPRGEWGIAPTLDGVRKFKQGVAVIFKITERYMEYDEAGSYPAVRGTYGLINKQGQTLLPPIYEAIESFQEGLAKIILAGKQGFINNQGKIAIPIQYEEVGNFSEGLAPVRQGSKWGYINSKGAVVIPCQFEEAQAFQKGWAVVRVGRKSSFRIITYSEEEGRRPSYEEERKTGYNLINKQGELQFAHHQMYLHIAREGVIITHNYKAAGAYNQHLEQLIPHQYKDLYYYGTGHFVANAREEQGRLMLYQGAAWSVKGNFLILGAYQGNFLVFSSNTRTKDKQHVGILNYQGEWIVEPRYEFASLEKSLVDQGLD